MNRIMLFRLPVTALVIGGALLMWGSAVYSQARIEFEELEYDWGEVMEGDTVTHEYYFYNKGNEVLTIEKVHSG